MKLYYRIGNLLKCCLILIPCTLGHAIDSHELIVESTGVGALDSVIYADTLPDGSRADMDRIYVLRRSTKYILSQTIQWSGFDLRIRAELGTGAKPFINFSGQHIFWLDENANLYLNEIHMNGRTDDLNVATRLIRMSGFKNKVIVNSCTLEEASQSMFRLNADSVKVFVTNTIFTRMGNPTDPNNGRLFDNRGHPIDTLLMKNSIAYYATSRFYRNGGDEAEILHGIFEHNTFYASGQYGFTFGKVTNLTFKNNLIANVSFLGETISEPRNGISLDTFIAGEMNIDISYNNFFIKEAYDILLPATRFGGEPVFSINGDFYNTHVLAAMVHLGTTTTNINEVLPFQNPPMVPADFIAASGDEFYNDAGVWDLSDLTSFPPYSEPGIDHYVTFHDFSYPDTTMSYTAGSNGQPLGAHLNFCNYPTKREFFLDTLSNGSYYALDSLILHGTNLSADSLEFVSKNIIELNPIIEGQLGKSIILRTHPLLCDEFIKPD